LEEKVFREQKRYFVIKQIVFAREKVAFNTPRVKINEALNSNG
jgi:hypothetical protein